MACHIPAVFYVNHLISRWWATPKVPWLWNMQLGILAEAKTLTERHPPVHVLFGVGVRMVIQIHSAMARVEALISSGVGGRWDTAVQPSRRHCFISTMSLQSTWKQFTKCHQVQIPISQPCSNAIFPVATPVISAKSIYVATR